MSLRKSFLKTLPLLFAVILIAANDRRAAGVRADEASSLVHLLIAKHADGVQ